MGIAAVSLLNRVDLPVLGSLAGNAATSPGMALRVIHRPLRPGPSGVDAIAGGLFAIPP